MNYLQLVQRTILETGRTGGGPSAIADAEGDDKLAKNWVADCWIKLQEDPRGWSFMMSRQAAMPIAASQTQTATSLGISATFGSWRKASREWAPYATNSSTGSRWLLQWCDYDLFIAHFGGVVAAGPPVIWSIDNDGSLVLGPTPDGTNYTLDSQFKKLATVLVVDTDVPSIPDANLHMILVWMALSEYGASDAAPEVVARAAVNYNTLLQSMYRKYGKSLKFGEPRT